MENKNREDKILGVNHAKKTPLLKAEQEMEASPEMGTFCGSHETHFDCEAQIKPTLVSFISSHDICPVTLSSAYFKGTSCILH